MKFKVIRSKFIEGLKSVQNIVAGKGSLPILQNVMIEGKGKSIKLTTTDLDISIKSEVECEILEEGSTTLPVKLLFTSVTKAAEGEVVVECDTQERATIKAGSARFKLQGMPASEFPVIPEDGEAYMYSIPQVTIREMLRKTSYAASQDDTRRTLKGVLMSFKDEKLTMVATDGRRLALVENELEFPKAAEGEVVVECDSQERATIKAGSARFKLQGMPASEFPVIPEDGEAYMYSIPQVTIREMLRKTAYAASQDDTRRTLKGVLMSFKDEKLTMVATDGRRLALVENELEFPKAAEKDIVLPSKAVAELQRSLAAEGEVSIMVKKSQICFTLGSVQIYSKLMDDTYPNYRQVIPKECAEQIVIDRQLLLNALDRASVMTIDEAHSTKLIFEANRLTVTSAASEIGEAKDEVPIKYAGEKIEIMFNPNYVMDPLKAIDDDEVTIGLNNGHSPAVIRCSIPFLYVLMPLRIN